MTFGIVAIVCAATRFLALARSLWDWDEALFCLGMRSYDVTSHHPHPPGFPVYIALGRIVRVVVHSDFRALQVVNIIAGMLVFPAMFFLARELRFPFVTAVIAAALCAFFRTSGSSAAAPSAISRRWYWSSSPSVFSFADAVTPTPISSAPPCWRLRQASVRRIS
jgi:hypothetical protein